MGVSMVYRFSRVMVFGLWAVAVGLAAWTYWPTSIQKESIELTQRDLNPGYPTGSSFQAVTGDQPRATLTLEWPAWSRTGDNQTIRLRLEPAASLAGSTQVAGSGHIVVETRIDIANLTTQPEGTAQQPWPEDKPLLFTWTVQPPLPGNYEGNVWFSLIFIRPDGRILARKDVSAQNLVVKAVGFSGITPELVRLASPICFCIGCLIGLWRLQVHKVSPSL